MTGPDIPTRLLPTFLIIGAMKAGTTSLFDRLGAHPDVGLSAVKEPDYFVAEKNLRRGLDWYSSLFAGTEEAVARGEASTSYSKCTEFPGVAPRIRAALPDVRLVYLLRDPVERIRSMYEHNVLMGRERRPLEVAVTEDPMYVGASSYALQLEQYLEEFPVQQVHVLTGEELVTRPEETLRRLCAHIGVDWDPVLLTYDPRSNITRDRRADTVAYRLLKSTRIFGSLQRSAPSAVTAIGKKLLTREPVLDARMPPATAAQLRAALAPDIARLEELLDRDFSAWRQDRARGGESP